MPSPPSLPTVAEVDEQFRILGRERQADFDRPRPGDAIGRVMATATDLGDCIFESAEALARVTADWLCEKAAISRGRSCCRR